MILKPFPHLNVFNPQKGKPCTTYDVRWMDNQHFLHFSFYPLNKSDSEHHMPNNEWNFRAALMFYMKIYLSVFSVCVSSFILIIWIKRKCFDAGKRFKFQEQSAERLYQNGSTMTKLHTHIHTYKPKQKENNHRRTK